MNKVAILVDGGFYRIRSRKFWNGAKRTPQQMADDLCKYCALHTEKSLAENGLKLYRSFYYDCPPVDISVYNPFDKKQEQLAMSSTSVRMRAFLDELTRRPNFAIRRGRLKANNARYVLKADAQREFLHGRLNYADLTRDDIKLDVGQKGVDMRLGLDMVSLALKRLVDRIVLIADDADFVPAVKMARREGVQIILDPMGQHIADDLQEHVDDVCTFFGAPEFCGEKVEG